MHRLTHFSPLAIALLLLGSSCQMPGWSQPAPPKMKMSTATPPGIATPDRLDTEIGTLTSFDGVPDKATAQKVYDNLDYHHGVQAFLAGLQIASMDAMRKGLLTFGPANTTVVIYENLMDSKALWLTPNTTSVYMASWLQMTDEPWVLETPPDVLGIIDDHWFQYVGDFGRLGPDKGKGGKFLMLPPGYKGEVPEGYHVLKTNTYGHWVIWRGFQKNGSPKPAVDATKKVFKMYPWSKRANPPAMNFANASGKFNSTIHSMEFEIFEEINAVIQAEPSIGQNAEILGVLASIGIQKGREFAPDARMKRTLTEAAKVGAATVRTIMSQPRDEGFYLYPGESKTWTNPFVGGSYRFLDNGARLLDARAAFHFYATGITPAMAAKFIGKGSKYACGYLDKDGNPFDGSKTYKIHVPANPPMKDFWSFTLYDNQTRSMLQTDEQFPGIDNNREGLVQNEDGSWDLYFAPVAPKGKEKNWVQTVPGKGWNIIFRLYGPLEAWYAKTWRPGDPELVN